MTLFLALLSVFVLFLASVTIILLIVGPTILLQPRRRTAEFYRALGQPCSPADIGLAYEEINVPMADGIILNCWLIKAPLPPKGTVLYLHGVGDCKIDGIWFAKLLHDNGHNVLLYDSRRHGASGGHYCTYGFYEKHDVSRLIDFLERRSDLSVGKIGLFGTSMGAAVALQAATADTRVAAVIAENSFATLRSIFDDYQKRIIKLPFHYLRNFVIKRSEWLAGFKAGDVSPLDAVSHVRVPILFIYGTDDTLINHTYSLKLFEEAVGQKELFPIHGAAHTDTWSIAGEKYENKVIEFFNKNLT